MTTPLMQARSVVDVGCWRHATLLPTSTDVADLLKEQAVDACMRGGFGTGEIAGAAAGGRRQAWQQADDKWADGKRATSTQARRVWANIVVVMGGLDRPIQEHAVAVDEADGFGDNRQPDGNVYRDYKGDMLYRPMSPHLIYRGGAAEFLSGILWIMWSGGAGMIRTCALPL
ncbi:hypothetical protein ACLOJK_034156 [Asimina triloba]